MLARDDVLEIASALTLLLLAVDESGVTEVELAEGMTVTIGRGAQAVRIAFILDKHQG